jgi:hypothetical protein
MVRSSDEFEGVYLGRNDTGLLVGPPVLESTPAYVRLPLALSAAGLSVQSMLELTDWGGPVDGLLSYFEALASEWRGWVGSKAWADDSGVVSFSATHNGMTEVALREELKPYYGSDGAGAWLVDAIVPIEAGQLPDIATKMRAMLASMRTATPGDIDVR